MVCKECGKRIKGDPTRCPHCDAVLKETVSLGAIHAAQTAKKKPKKKKLSRQELTLRIALITVSVLAVLAILLGIGYLYIKGLIKDNANIDDKFTPDEQGELNVNTELPTKDILNVALFGLDERGETGETLDETGKGKSFHSDAIIILTIDRRDPDTPRVKMSSIARDTLVYVEGYNSKGNMTKLTHAFDYGYRKAKSADRADGKLDLTEADYKREGAKTAIKTINQNFNMNITEYMYVNFVEFMDIIDYVGGVTINVQQRELNELNKHVRAMEKECGRDLDTVKKAGEQTLSGGQALAYARIRKIDSDLKRANRQRDVLKAVFEKVKTTPVNKLPTVAAEMLKMCHTTLTAEEIVEMGTWAVTKNPEILNYTLPDSGTKYGYSWIWQGTHPNYSWVWIYDLKFATCLLHDFIYDTDTAKDQPRPTMPNEPKVTAGTTTTTTVGTDAPSTTTIPSYVVPPITSTDPTDIGDPTGSTADPTDIGDPTGSTTDPTDIPGTTDTDVVGPTNSTTMGETPPTESTTVPSVSTSETTTTTTTEFAMP